MTLPVAGSMLTALTVVEVLSAIGATPSSVTVCACPATDQSVRAGVSKRPSTTKRDCRYDRINLTPKYHFKGA
jgi:hypothetical protein